MGTPVPEIWPELEDAKWYCVFLDIFNPIHIPDGCDNPYLGRHCCCKTGAEIKAWHTLHRDCVWGTSLCFPAVSGIYRVTNIHGPYDDYAACNAECSC